MKALACALVLLAPTAGGARADTLRLFSYDPANADTRAAAGPLTVEFRQGLTRVTVLSLRSTEASATVELQPGREGDLGRGGLAGLIGVGAGSRDVYRVSSAREGAAMVAALCPGSAAAWMALARPRYGRDLRIYVLGDQVAGGRARLCRTLEFTFHGEWRLPSSGKFDESLFPHARGPRS